LVSPRAQLNPSALKLIRCSILYVDREVVAHNRSMLALSMNKIVDQGHLVLTAGAEGFAKLWVSKAKGATVVTPTQSRSDPADQNRVSRLSYRT
jgi:hypothetical protein